MPLRSTDESEVLSGTVDDAPAATKAFVTPAQLARYLDVHPQTIYRQIRKGALRVVRVGRVIRIRLADAVKYVQPRE
jgi:excisionase family DNA binding protein